MDGARAAPHPARGPIRETARSCEADCDGGRLSVRIGRCGARCSIGRAKRPCGSPLSRLLARPTGPRPKRVASAAPQKRSKSHFLQRLECLRTHAATRSSPPRAGLPCLTHPTGSSGRWRAAPAALEAQLPSEGAAAFRIATANAALRVQRVGASPSIAKLEDGVLVHPILWPDTDAYLFATEGGMEELLVAHGDAIPTYDVALPPDWGLRNAPGLPGLVEIRDAFGAARMRLWAGRAWDHHRSTGGNVSPRKLHLRN